MSQDTRLLTELERQKKYTDKLGDDFQYPLFNSQRALESQRRSGYRNSSAAAREIVDNAIEAKASQIDIFFDQSKRQKGKNAPSPWRRERAGVRVEATRPPR